MANGYLACELNACNERMKATIKIPDLEFVNCQMSKGHRGKHASSTFTCDICDKVRRGNPAYSGEEVTGEEVTVCFMCQHVHTYR